MIASQPLFFLSTNSPAMAIKSVKQRPTVIEMINDQTGIIVPVKTYEQTRENFAKDL